MSFLQAVPSKDSGLKMVDIEASGHAAFATQAPDVMAKHEAQPQEINPVAGLRDAVAYWLLLWVTGVSWLRLKEITTERIRPHFRPQSNLQNDFTDYLHIQITRRASVHNQWPRAMSREYYA
jgi:hypothetical protein